MKPRQKNKEDYIFFKSYQTRWRDNDVYGHMNNVVYYEIADSLVNYWLMSSGALKVPNDDIIGLVVQTQCNYFSQVKFPDRLTCGLVVERIGKTSVTYGIGLFQDEETNCSAQVQFVHVYVDFVSRRPVSLPTTLVSAIGQISKV